MSKGVRGIQVTYRLLVSRSDRHLQAELYRFGLQEPIPPSQFPLRHADTEPLVDLQALLHGVYNQEGFGDQLYPRSSPSAVGSRYTLDGCFVEIRFPLI